MMSFEEFIEAVKENILSYLPEEFGGADVMIRKVIKNNDYPLTGLTVHQSQFGNTAPTIYLDSYYANYRSDGDINRILNDMAQSIDVHTPRQSLDIDILLDWESVKENVLPRLTAVKGNDEYLSNKVYTPVEDLAVTYYILLHEGITDSPTVEITNDIMEYYGITKEELHEKAFDNMRRKDPPKIENIMEKLQKLLPEEMLEELDEELDEEIPDENPLYVITNKRNMFGAVEILDSHTMDMIKERLGDQEYIAIPSSVHEFLLMAADKAMPPEIMAGLIQEVNQNEVAPEDRLSDHVYKVDPGRHLFMRADKDMEVEQYVEHKSIEQKQLDIMMQPNVHERKIEQRGPRL